jgi:hypothetical protein
MPRRDRCVSARSTARDSTASSSATSGHGRAVRCAMASAVSAGGGVAPRAQHGEDVACERGKVVAASMQRRNAQADRSRGAAPAPPGGRDPRARRAQTHVDPSSIKDSTIGTTDGGGFRVDQHGPPAGRRRACASVRRGHEGPGPAAGRVARASRRVRPVRAGTSSQTGTARAPASRASAASATADAGRRGGDSAARVASAPSGGRTIRPRCSAGADITCCRDRGEPDREDRSARGPRADLDRATVLGEDPV